MTETIWPTSLKYLFPGPFRPLLHMGRARALSNVNSFIFISGSECARPSACIKMNRQGQLTPQRSDLLLAALCGALPCSLGVLGNLGLCFAAFQTRGAQMLLPDPLELADSLSHTTSLLIPNTKHE